jgi:DNA-binding CsgD family transcriptional regulator
MFGGAGSVIFDLNPGSGEISNWIGAGLEAGGDEYARYANAINPRMHFSLKAPLGHIAWDYRFISDGEMRRHAFYDWTLQYGGVMYFVGTRLFDDLESNTSAFTSVEFSPRHGHVTREMIETFAQVRGHIANAWRLNRLMHRSHASREIEVLMESHAACGLIVYDSKGRIRSVNDRAGTILRQCDGLVMRDGVLIAQLAHETDQLQALLQACWRTSTHGLGSPGGAVAITRMSGQPRYIVRVMPVAVPKVPFPPDLPAIVVTITDPVMPIDIEPEVLGELYGLTRREADLAVQLSAGLELRAAARSARMSYNTARSHIRILFHKTGARSQLQLVSILRGLNMLH